LPILDQYGNAIPPDRIEERSTLANPDPAFSEIFATPTSAGPTVTPDTALRSTAVYAAVRIISESVASLPFILHRRLPDGGKERATDHPLYRILRFYPNDEQTAIEFWEMQIGHVLTRGNAFAMVERNNAGDVTGLWPLPPSDVVIERRGKELIYTFHGLTGTAQFRTGEILHIRGLSKGSVFGLSPITLAKEAIGAGLAMEEYGARFFSNDGTPGGVLEYPGTLSSEAKQRLKESWETTQRGSRNAGRTAVLEAGLKYHAVSFTPEDSQFIESRKFQLQEIARIFRIPPHMLGDLSKSSFSNIEQQSLEFVMHTLRPWLDRIEQAVMRDVLTPTERELLSPKFQIDGLLRGDQRSRFEAYSIGLQNGIYSINEVRALENLNPIANGNQHLRPLNEIPIAEQPESDEPRERTVSLPPEIRASEPEEIPARSRLVRAQQEIFTQLGRQILKRETRRVEAILERHTDAAAFRDALDRFYEEFRSEVQEQIEGPYRAYAQSIRKAALEEIGHEGDPPAPEKFLSQVIGAAAARWVSSSRNQLRALVKESPQDFPLAIQTRLAEWEEKRAEKFASQESVQVGGAIAKATFVDAGITQFRWTKQGKCSPFCDQIDGKVVGINQPFVAAGSVIDSDDATQPIQIAHNIHHPPLVRSCSCRVDPVLPAQGGSS